MRQAGLSDDVRIEDLVEEARTRSSRAEEVIGVIGRSLGLAIANALNVLDLSTVVLSGYLAPIAEEITPVQETVDRTLWPLRPARSQSGRRSRGPCASRERSAPGVLWRVRCAGELDREGALSHASALLGQQDRRPRRRPPADASAARRGGRGAAVVRQREQPFDRDLPHLEQRLADGEQARSSA